MHHQQWRKEPNPLEIHNYKQEIWNYQWIQTLHKTPVMPAELGLTTQMLLDQEQWLATPQQL